MLHSANVYNFKSDKLFIMIVVKILKSKFIKTNSLNLSPIYKNVVF